MTEDDEAQVPDAMAFTKDWANYINKVGADLRALTARNSELEKDIRKLHEMDLFLRVLMDKQVETLANGQGDVTKAAEAYATGYTNTYCMLHGMPADQRDAAAEAAGKAAWDKAVADMPKPRRTLRAVAGDTVWVED